MRYEGLLKYFKFGVVMIWFVLLRFIGFEKEDLRCFYSDLGYRKWELEGDGR